MVTCDKVEKHKKWTFSTRNMILFDRYLIAEGLFFSLHANLQELRALPLPVQVCEND